MEDATHRASVSPGPIDTSNPGLVQIAAAFAGLLEAGDRLDALPRVVERLDKAVELLEASSAAVALMKVVEDGLHPDRVYSFDEAARFVGKKKSSLYKEPEAVLPPVKSRGRSIGFRGIDLLAYRGDITRDVADAYKEAQVNAVLRKIAA